MLPSPASPDPTSEQHSHELSVAQVARVANLCEGDRLLELDRGASGPPPAPDTTQPMRLYAMDAWVRDASVLTNPEELNATLRAAAAAGGATVVGEEFYAFPNGAVTGVLLLAQSHLSVHTWPELGLANVDLLSCGDIDGSVVLARIRSRLAVERSRVRCIQRSLV